MRKFYSNTGIRSEESRPKAIKSFGNKFLAKLYLLHCTGNDEKRKGEEPHHFILQRTTIRDSRQIQTSNKSFNVTDGIYKVVPSLLLPFLLSLSCGFSASWPQSEFYPPHDRSILTKFSLRPTRISSRISILSSRISRHCPSNVIVSGPLWKDTLGLLILRIECGNGEAVTARIHFLYSHFSVAKIVFLFISR